MIPVSTDHSSSGNPDLQSFEQNWKSGIADDADDGRLFIRLEFGEPLGLGNTARFLERTDELLEPYVASSEGRATIEYIGTGSLIVIILVGGGGAAGKAAWEVFKYFHTIWVEDKRIQSQRDREDELRREQRAHEDTLRREAQEREDQQRREAEEREQRLSKREVDPSITNIIISTSGVLFDFSKHSPAGSAS